MSAPHVPSVLDAIVAAARKRVDVARARRSQADLERVLSQGSHGGSRPSFVSALQQPGLRIIAECKRRSPSRGVLRAEYDPVAIAAEYADAGAAAVSVLTEPAFFDGDLEHLVAVRAALPSLPLLRKDFTIDAYQIAEAAVAGAAAILLIVAALDQATLRRLLAYASALEIDVLTEVHDEDEAHRAIDAGATIVGVNNRNLKTLEVSVATSHRVAPIIASAQVRVAESGLRSGADLSALQAAGYGAFLIGERFMTESHPGAGLARILAEARAATESRG
jgi:indole-3-glycerol phosphate synthase